LKSLRAAGIYALLTVLFTYPLAFRLRIMDPGDSAYFAWAIGWEIHALKTDPGRLPHGNIYHPARYTLFMDEPILGTTLLVLPFSLFTDDAVLLFGLARLLTYLVSALAAYLLARELGCGEAPSLLAGAVFAFSPIRTDQLAHLSTLGSQWLPFTLLYMIRFARTARGRDAGLAGLFYVLASYACGYHGLMGLLVLPVAAVPLVWGRWRLLPKALPALALVIVCLLPLRLLHQRAFESEGFVRPEAQAIYHSTGLESFLATSSLNWIYGELTTPFRSLSSNNLFPGLVAPALALAGAWRLWRARRRPSREALALGLLILAAAFVALGPEVRLMGHNLFPSPYLWLRRAVPVLQGIRVSSRAGIFIALGLAPLAALGLRAWSQRPRLLALVALAALAETLIIPVSMPAWAQVIDTRKPIPPVYEWLRVQPVEVAVIELPIVPGDFTHPAFDESVYMVRSTWHWQRLVNGNAGVEPADYKRVRELSRRFPSQESIAALRELKVQYVLLNRGGYGPNQWARIERDLPGFEECCLDRVAEFPGVTVFGIRPVPPP
jgi:hypothetical protein